MLSDILLSPLSSLFFYKVSLEDMVAAPLLLKITLTYLSVASRSPFCTQDVIAPVNPLAQWLELIYIHFHKNESLNLLCILSLFLLLHYIINY